MDLRCAAMIEQHVMYETKDHHSRREILKEDRVPCGKFDTTVANERRDIFKKSVGDFAEKLVSLTELPVKPELVKVFINM